jgi:hypothetical protein
MECVSDEDYLPKMREDFQDCKALVNSQDEMPG